MLTHDEQYIRPEEASKILQVTPGTLRSWSLQGKLKFVITKGRHRRYLRSSVLGYKEQCDSGEKPEEIKKEKICYARVSSYSQKKDLDTQLKFFQDKYPNHKCIRDLGSGLNFKRKGFLYILDSASKGTIEELVITHRDRLCRFGFEIIERLVQKTTMGGSWFSIMKNSPLKRNSSETCLESKLHRLSLWVKKALSIVPLLAESNMYRNPFLLKLSPDPRSLIHL